MVVFAKRWQVRVRTMLVIVALVALLLSPFAYVERRRDRVQRLADYHASQMSGYTIDWGGFRPIVRDHKGRVVRGKQARLIRWHYWRKVKYESAAMRPWKSVPPARPKPEM